MLCMVYVTGLFPEMCKYKQPNVLQESASHTSLTSLVQVKWKVDVCNYNANAHKINDRVKTLILDNH